jgi:NADPH2:quinone reductase
VKAISIRHPGATSQLVLEDRPTPIPAEGEVLIKVSAAGVNRGDLLQRQGKYPPPKGASEIPGLEVAGEVIAQGSRGQSLAIGSRICALLSGGGYAEYVTTPESLCFPIPEKMTDSEAAAIPEALFTVWENVFRRGQLEQGQTLLVQGGTSGIGTLAIPLALKRGARVIATAGSDEKCVALRALGAAPINYRTENLVASARSLNDGKDLDVILDLIGATSLNDHLELLATEGRLVMIALQGGHRAEVNLLPILTKRLHLTGSTLRSRPLPEKVALATEIRKEAWPWLASGEIRPTIAAVFPLDQAEHAHALMQSSRHIGKIILEMPF